VSSPAEAPAGPGRSCADNGGRGPWPLCGLGQRPRVLAVGRLFLAGALCLGAVTIAAVSGLAQAQPTAAIFEEYSDLATRLPALEPTPVGEGHLGQLESGAYVQLRFPVPKELPVAYALQLGNVVAYTGKGTSYKLLLRRDALDGAVLYEGPVILTSGDEWNAENRRPIDITSKLTPDDAARGYLDVFVTAETGGDGWTVYRHNHGRPILALVVEASEEMRQAMLQQQAMVERGLALLPAPQRMELAAGDFRLTDDSRIVLPAGATDDDRFAAADLAEHVKQACGRALAIETGARAGSADVALSRGDVARGGPEGYRLVVDDRGVRVVGGGAPGVFYGAQTVAQLVTERGALPHVTIEDWPDYPLRGLQYDVARGQTVEVEWWKRVIRGLAHLKLNAIMIYGEDDYRFRAFPFLGREGTFTPEKAAEISAFAARYHLQLIPQFESLGHASAVLQHDELADLREAGGAWVFCTCNPATWEFLDKVYGELCEQFPSCRYIHTGADEFESGFGKCPACSERVARDGYTGLYAEHMNRMNELVKKHGRTMLFWPSHGGPTPELSYLTIKARDLMQRDCIPTEWIYHGPPTYPQIQEYQDLGFKDVWAAAAVVCFSRIWPDYPTTFRGIRGFLKAGAERGIGGAMTTTWEWMHGGVVANSLLGMAYSAECAWSLGKTSVADYQRRYGQRTFGLTPQTAAEQVRDVLADPWPREGPAALLRDSRLMTDLFFEDPRAVRSRLVLRSPGLSDNAQAAYDAVTAAQERLATLRQECESNWQARPHVKLARAAGPGQTPAPGAPNADLLAYTKLAFDMYGHALLKVLVLEEASKAYSSARKLADDRDARADALEGAAGLIENLPASLDPCLETYRRAVTQLGAWKGDVDRMVQQRDATVKLAADLRELAGKVRKGEVAELPAASQFGLTRGQTIRVGTWEPAQMDEGGCEIRLDVTDRIKAAGEMLVEWNYTRGAHGVSLDSTELLTNGVPVATDTHGGWTGAGSHDNSYRLKLESYDPAAKYEILGKMRSSGGTDSRGEVWLIFEE